MHGAAVVIDVRSGEVRVLASAPGFDPNRFDEEYAGWTSPSNLDKPLLNRATQALREPGSTIKPVVGMAGVASGVRRPDELFECIGYMVVDGKVSGRGRCWVTSMFHKVLCRPDCTLVPCPTVRHHPVPSYAAHPTGLLTLADALERSCNPYFESIAHALGPVRLSDWYRKFGLGRPTYLGIAEAAGRVPIDFERLMRGPEARASVWSAGIGQGPVAVTPLQMANVAATIARDGVWVRPKLLREGAPPNYPAGSQGRVPPTTQLADRVELGIPPEALRAVRQGMFNVVNGRAGSGDAARRKDVMVAGKTGTAEAALLRVPKVDPRTGRVVRGDDGKVELETLELSTHDAPNPRAPWYRATGRHGDQPHHSWFVGFAPADDPQIAFAVMVEYGGSGGGAAGSVASRIVELCVRHGYLTVKPKADPVAAATQPVAMPTVAAPLAPAAEVELLHDAPATTRAAGN
jgi:penicillin-binding protein 2